VAEEKKQPQDVLEIDGTGLSMLQDHIYREIKIPFRFEYLVFYFLYPFVTYLLIVSLTKLPYH
jgi:hypothetical protein